eukprot:GHVT01097105.1.p2 GENE.GHVT01097105.1~~GHVT01097105.1.p2  ORF type:complete len:169 (+),score=41.43 GHVT01097105.1:1554-2060(+)
MAYRFRREGLRVKVRTHWERSGMRPWVDEFRWEVQAWHYRRFMKPRAEKLLRTLRSAAHDQDSSALYELYRVLHSGGGGASSPWSSSPASPSTRGVSPGPSGSAPWHPTALPLTVPFLRSSNPFCPVSANRTGWEVVSDSKVAHPKPHKKHKIGGTCSKLNNFPTMLK